MPAGTGSVKVGWNLKLMKMINTYFCLKKKQRNTGKSANS